jgi:hypothetical protein
MMNLELDELVGITVQGPDLFYYKVVGWKKLTSTRYYFILDDLETGWQRLVSDDEYWSNFTPKLDGYKYFLSLKKSTNV